MIVRRCEFGRGSFRCRFLALTPKAEHFCVGAYATAEVVGSHLMTWWLSIGIALTVVGSMVYDRVSPHDPA